MGSYAYDYLNDSLILDRSLITRLYSGVSDAALEKELRDYREYCLNVLPETRNSIKASDTFRCMVHGYKSHDYKSKRTANPCYFLWNVKQKAKT
ncbi:hypothetical protein D8S93_03965 [Vibrio sp. VGrn 2]|nr:hypothetical protein [Vibrio sp. VGrn 2]